MSDDGFDLERLAALVAEIGEHVTEVKRRVVEGDDEGLVELADDLWELLDEVEDVLSTVDFEELPEAIDVDELPEAVDVEDIPAGLFDEDESAIDLTDVMKAVNLRELWDAVDLTELRKEKKELDAAIDDVREYGSDDGAATDEEEEDGMFANVVESGEEAAATATSGLHKEYLEDAIQSAVEDFRKLILATHDQVYRLYRANQEKLGQPGRQPDSLNPSAYSSMPSGPIPDSVSTRTSTVPSQVRYSRQENPRRIYGRRFEEESARRESERENEGQDSERTDDTQDDEPETDGQEPAADTTSEEGTTDD